MIIELVVVSHALYWAYIHLFRSDLPNIIQVSSGAVAVYALRKFNCATKRCPRLGKHVVKGTTYRTCTKHAVPAVHDQLKKQHAIARPEQHKLLN